MEKPASEFAEELFTKYRNYSVDELVLDDFFVDAITGNNEGAGFWQKLAGVEPVMKERIKSAAEIVTLLKSVSPDRPEPLSDRLVSDMLKKILEQ